MTPKQIFEQFPKATVCYQAGSSEYFLEKSEADAYAKHFNVAVKEVKRSEIADLKAEDKTAKKAAEEAKKAEEEAAKKAAEEAKKAEETES